MMWLASYLLKVIACSGILFLYYHIALRNKIFHQWNRFYLLAAVLISIAAPIAEIQIQSSSTAILQPVYSAHQYLDTVVITRAGHAPYEYWLLIGYMTISAVMLMLFIYSIMRIVKMIRSHAVTDVDTIRFINTNVDGTPFSFFKYIFWNQSIRLDTQEGQHIFQHELVHVKEKHTYDNLFVQVVIALFWCNPFFWLMRRELKTIHEFIADKKAVGQYGAAAFAAMILQVTYRQHYHALTNPFFHTSIKRRLTMISKKNHAKLNYFSRIVALPVIAFAVMAFSFKMKEEKVITSVTQSITQMIAPEAEPPVDTLPKQYYKGKEIITLDVSGERGMVQMTLADGSRDSIRIADSEKLKIKIPPPPPPVKLSDPKNADGTTPLIIVNGKEWKDNLNTINPERIASVNVLKNHTASEKYGSKGKNGVIEIQLKPNNTLTLKADSIHLKTSGAEKQPLYVVDGKEYFGNINEIAPANIQTINVLKDKTAMDKYGEKGRNGVIEIVTKKKDELKEVIVEGKPLNNSTGSIPE